MDDIFAGVDEIIDEHLALLVGPGYWDICQSRPVYGTREAYNKIQKTLTGHKSTSCMSAILRAMYARLLSNYFNSDGGPTAGDENWRCEARIAIDPKNKSPEVRLERKIAELCPEWINQVPVASGLVGSGNRRNCIDLAWKRDRASAVFVELKWKANNPLYATFEIAKYGLVYLLARQHCGEAYDGREWMAKDGVVLAVLAPTEFYGSQGLPEVLESSIDQALQALTGDFGNGLRMRFCLASFDDRKDCTDDAAIKNLVANAEARFVQQLQPTELG